MSKRDLLNFTDVSRDELQAIFGLARELKRKQKQGVRHELLRGKGMALVFEKPSLRTRVSFEVGMAQLGGYVVFLGPTRSGWEAGKLRRIARATLPGGLTSLPCARSHKRLSKKWLSTLRF